MATNTDSNNRKGWHGDSKGHARAGQAGGRKTAQTHGQAFYSQIGRRGGKISTGNFKNDPERARMAGQKGGRARSRKNVD